MSRGNRLVLFLVDASDSMESSAGLAAAKGAVLSLLSAAYIRRDRVGLIAFRDERARVLLPPTSSIHLAREKLRLLTAGGATPFADGLLTAWKTIRSDGLKHPSRKTVLVVLSDGEANVPLVPGADKAEEIAAVAELIRREKIRTVFVDTNPPGKERVEPMEFSRILDAEYRRISRVGAGELVDLIDGTERN
jgi:magnesium chelatase subunit D